MGEVFDDIRETSTLGVIAGTASVKVKSDAVKYDNGKPRMDLLPPKALNGIADVFGYGAKKYEDFNYKNGKGLLWSRVYAACLRHLNDWNGGEDIDPESGKPHLYHAGCCVMMLIDLIDSGIGSDTRFKGTNEAKG